MYPGCFACIHLAPVLAPHHLSNTMNKRIIESAAALSALAKIGQKAVEHHQTESVRRARLEDLRTAYREYSQGKGLGFIEKKSPAWLDMEAACAAEYQALQGAKAKVYNARRRLATAIRRAGVSA